MEGPLLEAAKQVPSLIVLAVLVYWFLKYLKEDREFIRTLTEKYEANERQISADYKELSQSVSHLLGRALAIIEYLEKKYKIQ